MCSIAQCLVHSTPLHPRGLALLPLVGIRYPETVSSHMDTTDVDAPKNGPRTVYEHLISGENILCIEVNFSNLHSEHRGNSHVPMIYIGTHSEHQRLNLMLSRW